MFIDNNEFFHVTDNMTSLYKIISRSKGKNGNEIFKVVSEVGNIYSYSFDEENKDIIIFSQKGFGLYYQCLKPYKTKVFDNINR